ncbi:MAG: chemotaxis protein CheD [Nanobdellota archaeon]
MAEEIMADMGKYIIGESPKVLVALGLGSCIGCALYDPEKKIGGLAHVMLPSSEESRKNVNPNKFADKAIPAMIDDMKKKGCRTERIKAKIVGGAHMFGALQNSDAMDIGKKNSKAVREVLDELGIDISSAITGGQVGRTIKFNTDTGKISIRTKDGIQEV